MKPIKILQVFTILNRGGAEVNLMNYYRHFDREKFHFDFLVHRFEEGAFEQEIKTMGGEIFRIRPLHPLTFQKYNKEADQFFRKNKDYSIVHNHTSELSYLLLNQSAKHGVPVHIVHAHNSEMVHDPKSLYRLFWRNLLRKKAKHYFTCSPSAAGWLLGKDHISEAWQMNNAIETAQFQYNPEIAAVIKQRENISGNCNFIHTGRFNHQKNHLFLLDVFAELSKTKPEAQLYLVGDGELRPQIEERIRSLHLEKKVHLLGVRSDVAELLQAIDYFVFPSLFEGLPVSLVEAQTSSIQCFISDGVPKEAILVPENVEMISLKKTPKEWAEIILQNLDYERKDTSSLIKAAGYDIVENAKKLEQKYLELLSIGST